MRKIRNTHAPVKRLPSAERLHELLAYNPEDGTLSRKAKVSKTPEDEKRVKNYNGRLAGKPAGSIKVTGYVHVKVDYTLYQAHRLIWQMMVGEVPTDMCVDHIDGNPSNNRLENLRLVSQATNMQNQKLYTSNKSGVAGVYWHRSHKKWRAEFEAGGVLHKVGFYDDVESARIAITAARQVHGFSRRHGTPVHPGKEQQTANP